MEIQRGKEEKKFKYSKEEKKRTDRRGESMNANEAGRRIIGVITLTLQWLNGIYLVAHVWSHSDNKCVLMYVPQRLMFDYIQSVCVCSRDPH